MTQVFFTKRFTKKQDCHKQIAYWALLPIKNALLCVFLLTLPFTASAQYEELEIDSAAADTEATTCTEICGVKFGEEFENAKSILENKFGREQAYAENYELIFANKSYAGVWFDTLIFGFQSDGTNTYFNKCVLCLTAKNAEDAKRKRDYLYQVLSDKYFMLSKIDTDKFKYYVGGTSPVNEDDFGFYIDVFHKGNFWSARLYYGPYNYVNEEF